MSFVIGILMTLGALLFSIVLWKRLPVDAIGRRARIRRKETGFHGQLTEWIYWDAPLDPPAVDEIGDASRDRSGRIGDRALLAVLHRHAAEKQVSLEEAHRLLLEKDHTARVRAFLRGKMRRAIRSHWRTRYRGPHFLFYPWFYLVAAVRYGRRHLYLESLSGILQELEKE